MSTTASATRPGWPGAALGCRAPGGTGAALGDGDHGQGDDEDADQQGEVPLHRYPHVQLPVRTDSYLVTAVTGWLRAGR
jgi:hypothetical protein